MVKLWQKHWTLDQAVEHFETNDDLCMDHYLVKADIAGSLAHAAMLHKIGILSLSELNIAQKGLRRIYRMHTKDTFKLHFGDEDVHTKIEHTLTRWYGPVGKKIHAGRSRNDQVVTAIRLFTKEELQIIWEETLSFAAQCVAFARTYEFIPMPGYTHMQKAMPSSVGLWASSFAEQLLDCIESIKTSYELNDQSPLGSAAGYGVPLALDREYTTSLLGFKRVQRNSLSCQNSRGIIEASIIGSCLFLLQILSKFASDIALFTTHEFDYFYVADKLCSGSSIMPQKRNVDIAELLRSKVYLALGSYVAIIGTTGGLVSGYNRDLQDTKKPLIESLYIAKESIAIGRILLAGLTPNIEKLSGSMTPEIFAAHRALALVKEGVAFRDAYHVIGKNLEESPAPGYFGYDMTNNFSVDSLLRAASHTGATGNLQLEKTRTQLTGERRIWRREHVAFCRKMNVLLKY